MEITQTESGEVLIFALAGRLDAKTSEPFEQQMLAALAAGRRKLLIDFSSLDYISSAGLRVLLLAAKKLQESKGKIVLCALKPALKTVFEIAGFSSIFPIFDSPADGLTDLTKA